MLGGSSLDSVFFLFISLASLVSNHHLCLCYVVHDYPSGVFSFQILSEAVT